MTMNLELIKRAVQLAGRAPSLHNSQPWQWVVDGSELQLHLDHSRIVRHTDSTGREAMISCGAMLDHLRVAAAASGWRTFVERFPIRIIPHIWRPSTSGRANSSPQQHVPGPAPFCGAAQTAYRSWRPTVWMSCCRCYSTSSTVPRHEFT